MHYCYYDFNGHLVIRFAATEFFLPPSLSLYSSKLHKILLIYSHFRIHWQLLLRKKTNMIIDHFDCFYLIFISTVILFLSFSMGCDNRFLCKLNQMSHPIVSNCNAIWDRRNLDSHWKCYIRNHGIRKRPEELMCLGECKSVINVMQEIVSSVDSNAIENSAKGRQNCICLQV